MAVGLFWNDRVSFEKHEWAKRFFFLGNNTGNLVFIRALKDIFHPVMIPLWDVTSDTFRDRADITHYITTELIWLTPNQTYPHVWTMLKRIGDKPLVPISVGVQSMARNVDITLHPDTVKLLRTMAERAVLGVRGEYTAAVLEKNGIDPEKAVKIEFVSQNEELSALLANGTAQVAMVPAAPACIRE